MSVFSGFSAALIPNSATPSSMQTTFSGLMSTTGTHPWQILRQAVVGTAISSSGPTATSFATPGNAFDMTSTTSATTASLPAYVGINAGTTFTPTVLYIQADYSNSLNYAPLTFQLYYSPTGSSWTLLQSFTSQTNWYYGERRKFTVTGATANQYWAINVTAAISGSTCYIGDVQLEDTSGHWLTTTAFFDCIPPSVETIGNSYARDVLRWQFPATGTSIKLLAVQEILTATPEVYSFSGATTGAVTCSITINANTVSYIGTTGYTALQNARGLYEACKASVNANFTAWNWVWNNNQTAITGGMFFYAVCKTSTAIGLVITSSNITASARAIGVFTVPMVQGCLYNPGASLTIDIINGWIYYLQINQRGIAIGSKTNSNYYTPIHACYGDNASAIAQIPTSELSTYGLPCTPIELLVGLDNVVADSDGYAYPTHFWGIPYGTQVSTNIQAVDASTAGAGYSSPSSIFNHMLVAGMLQDISDSSAYTIWNANNVQMPGEAMFDGADAGVYYTIQKCGSLGASNATYMNSTYVLYARFFSPSYTGLDWYKFSGTAPSNEQILVSSSTDFTATISTTGLITDTTIYVASTTGFPTAGYFVMDGEVVQYTGGGGGGTSFTGCTRGKFGTTAVSPISGNTIYISAWFVFLVQGLVFSGYAIPT